ncbi:hypothetical protein PAXRUDRAFT_492943 [Paxillus rubicundulus Ve08.2h10]|uniref:Uncharacterized protein n=1 Tax=Paxillus rubicundulus Ve08.2h10 TaxID=930991 RepID=A0A0D0E788_9AGAM|nr:hypothetical protein PAXRUDRAFT_492943 [Paxillus rubicundulus Ve08.2h10]
MIIYRSLLSAILSVLMLTFKSHCSYGHTVQVRSRLRTERSPTHWTDPRKNSRSCYPIPSSQ